MATCLVTCGPASEPIDAVRRITNFSTGELGMLLTAKLAESGHSVVCWKGEAAAWPDPESGEIRHFQRNDDLLAGLQKLSETWEIDHIFHAAALSDFRVDRVTDDAGNPLDFQKIPSALAALQLHLRPAAKVLRELRSLFPKARITGWKYELEGTASDAIERGWEQIVKNKTDACVVNGRSFGNGFALLAKGTVQRFPDKTSLCAGLAATIR